MDIISDLPDEIISKILSSLQTIDVMQTMVLSKRWKSLWTLVPSLKFEFDVYIESKPNYVKYKSFVDRSLMSRQQGQVLQSLYLKLSRVCRRADIESWVETAVKFGVIELKLEYSSTYYCSPGSIPRSVYSCETLVVLKLENGFFYVRDLVSLPSLKTLSLNFMWYTKTNDSLFRLLPNCPVLEDLFIEHRSSPQNPVDFKIVSPSLKKLSLVNFSHSECVINTPALQYLGLCLVVSQVVFPVDNCFHRLKYLEIGTCKSEWLGLFMHLLENSPSLKVIKIIKCHSGENRRPQWNQPGSVPRCLSSNLETFEWRDYKGTTEEKELSMYILKNAVCLKKASFITAKSIDDYKKKMEMLQELSLSPRISSTCHLVLN